MGPYKSQIPVVPPSDAGSYAPLHASGLRCTSFSGNCPDQISGSHSYYADANVPSSCPPNLHMKQFPQRRPSNRDEFDGPAQFLEKPGDGAYEPREEELPQLSITLNAKEQDKILGTVNDHLSECAFHFFACYQFPIPIEPDKRPVRVPGDREWSEWVHLLKRLTTRRRIPARVLYGGQIKQLITILENSLEMRHAAKHQSRPLKDDRNILQLISSGLQVAKILKNAAVMRSLDGLYVETEQRIHERRDSEAEALDRLGPLVI